MICILYRKFDNSLFCTSLINANLFLRLKHFNYDHQIRYFVLIKKKFWKKVEVLALEKDPLVMSYLTSKWQT